MLKLFTTDCKITNVIIADDGTGSVLYICKPYVVKTARSVNPIPDEYDIDDMRKIPKQFRDYMIGWGLAQHIPKSLCDGFVRYLGLFDTEANFEVIPFKKPVARFPRYAQGKLIAGGSGDEKITNIVMDYGGGRTLEKYLSDNPDINIVRSILFQVLHTLLTLRDSVFFQHNDLHAGNVLLKALEQSEYLYHDEKAYKITGYRARITDFELSNVTFPAVGNTAEYSIYNSNSKPDELYDVATLSAKLGGNKELNKIVPYRIFLAAMSNGKKTLKELLDNRFFNVLKV